MQQGVFEVAVMSLPATLAGIKVAFTFLGLIYMQKYDLYFLVSSVPKPTAGESLFEFI